MLNTKRKNSTGSTNSEISNVNSLRQLKTLIKRQGNRLLRMDPFHLKNQMSIARCNSLTSTRISSAVMKNLLMVDSLQLRVFLEVVYKEGSRHQRKLLKRLLG